MPLQNRVDPFSHIHAVTARGLFTGNRGILHNHQTQTLRKQSWATEGWVICTLAPLPGRQKRPRLMSKGKWTELFFLDEAVGLAAGHRPCYACRKREAEAFRDAIGLDRISQLNPLIHADMKPRLRVHNAEPPRPCSPSTLPDGAFYAVGDQAFLVWEGEARRFGWNGYGEGQALHRSGVQLTPRASCKALRNGYKPLMHPSL